MFSNETNTCQQCAKFTSPSVDDGASCFACYFVGCNCQKSEKGECGNLLTDFVLKGKVACREAWVTNACCLCFKSEMKIKTFHGQWLRLQWRWKHQRWKQQLWQTYVTFNTWQSSGMIYFLICVTVHVLLCVFRWNKKNNAVKEENYSNYYLIIQPNFAKLFMSQFYVMISFIASFPDTV